MRGMFAYARAFRNGDKPLELDTSVLRDVTGMLENCPVRIHIKSRISDKAVGLTMKMEAQMTITG
jgi:hypothetical protein